MFFVMTGRECMSTLVGRVKSIKLDFSGYSPNFFEEFLVRACLYGSICVQLKL